MLDTRVGININDDAIVVISPPSRLMGREKAKHKEKEKNINFG